MLCFKDRYFTAKRLPTATANCLLNKYADKIHQTREHSPTRCFAGRGDVLFCLNVFRSQVVLCKYSRYTNRPNRGRQNGYGTCSE